MPMSERTPARHADRLFAALEPRFTVVEKTLEEMEAEREAEQEAAEA